MFYIVQLKGAGWNTHADVSEFDSESDAVYAASKVPRTKLVCIFKGERLEPVMGDRKIVKKGITGFQKPEEIN